jgi:hypothetical protein
LRQGTQISPLIFLPFIFLPFYLEIWKAIGKKMMGKKIKEQPATNDSKTERKKSSEGLPKSCVSCSSMFKSSANLSASSLHGG